MYKQDFPLLADNPHIHYLDSAATAQRPRVVLDTMHDYSTRLNGNAGRGSHTLAIESAQCIEAVRSQVADFLSVADDDCIIFTKNCTESLNIIAFCHALPTLTHNDHILLSIANHHANIVPWQIVAEKTGAKLDYVGLTADGSFDIEDFNKKLIPNTKILSFSHMVNTTGVVFPMQEIIKRAKENGTITVVDAAQSIVHHEYNLSCLGADFLVFSGHKLFSAFGVGVLAGKKKHFKTMPPFLYGGSMIEWVETDHASFKDAPDKYEGGTMDAMAIASLGSAIRYVNNIGYQKMAEHIKKIDDYATTCLQNLPFVECYHVNGAGRSGIIAFNVKNVHSHDTAHILNEFGVYVRSGHHCTQPLMQYLNVPSCCRASFAVYTEKADIDALVTALHKVHSIFNE